MNKYSRNKVFAVRIVVETGFGSSPTISVWHGQAEFPPPARQVTTQQTNYKVPGLNNSPAKMQLTPMWLTFLNVPNGYYNKIPVPPSLPQRAGKRQCGQLQCGCNAIGLYRLNIDQNISEQNICPSDFSYVNIGGNYCRLQNVLPSRCYLVGLFPLYLLFMIHIFKPSKPTPYQ